MVDRLIVPIDGSDSSWSAFDVAVALGRASNGSITAVQVVAEHADVDELLATMNRHVAERDLGDVAVDVSIEHATGDVVDALADVADRTPGSTFVLASHGRGRAAAVLGSVTDELLRRTFGPMVVVGPEVDTSAASIDFAGPIVVTVDGTDVSESAVPLAAAWAIELRSEAWIVEVLRPDVRLPPDVGETVYTSRLAARMRALSGHDVQFDVLHGDPVDAVTGYAASRSASLLVAATHGRSGVSRLALGSTAAGFVRHAHCPVLLLRPPHLPDEDARTRHAETLLG